MENEIFEDFLTTIITNNEVFLLQADDGLFAMLEGNDGRSFLPVWGERIAADQAVKDEWDDYTVQEMEIKELISWLNELHEDGIWIGVAPDKEGKVIPFEAEQLQQLILLQKKK